MENDTFKITKTILLVEPDPADRANQTAVLSHQGWTVRATDNSYEAIQWLKNDTLPALLIIANNAAPLNASQALDYIRREIHSEVPVMIAFSDTSEVPEHGRETDYLVKPLDSAHIAKIRHLMEPVTETGQVYSMNYLNMLADGNNDFILDCLGVFKTSVAAKLGQLNEALQKEDYKSIAEIAHNIKPSFEMLENASAAAICNALSYNAPGVEFPGLVDELNTIFNSMIHKLDTDFPELK